MRKSVHSNALRPTSKIRFRALMGTALGSLCASYAPAFAADKAPVLEEIVVTAEKRAETTLNISREIQAFTSADLQNAGVKDVQNLQLVTPGLNFGNQSSTQRVYIRGVGTLLAGNGLDPAVATYIDDRYVANDQGALGLDFLDLNHVEVLKGPQGTLFGRNAAAGAVQVLSNDVTHDFEGSLTATAGNYNAWGLQGVINIPITSNLGIRLAALTTKRDGFSKNLYPGGARDWNDKDLQEFRGKIHWDINDRISSDLTLSYWEKNDQDGNASVVPEGVPLSNTAITPSAVYSQKNGYVGTDINGPTNAGHETAAEWRFNIKADPFDIVSITTGSIYKHTSSVDADATSLPAIDLTAGRQSLTDFSQEIRLVSNKTDSKLKWLAGLYYYKNNDAWVSYLTANGVARNTGLQTLKTEAFATFGSATYSFTDQWALVLGARWSRESKNVRYEVPAPPNAVPSLTKIAEKRWYDITPDLSLQFKPGFGMFYFTYSQGFKSGGFNYPFNPSSNINPEHLTSYVVGYKGDVADGRLRLEAAGFHYNYDNMQVTHASNVPGVPVTENAASSTINGLELQATWVPTEWINLTAGGSWTDGRYNQFKSAQGVADTFTFPRVSIDASGRRLLWLSKWSYFVQASNDTTVLDGKLHTELTWSWKSDYDYDLPADRSDPNLKFLTQKGYGLLNGRISYTVPNGKWEVAMWANNILDQEYYTIVNVSPGFPSAQFAAPQTFGADVTYKF